MNKTLVVGLGFAILLGGVIYYLYKDSVIHTPSVNEKSTETESMNTNEKSNVSNTPLAPTNVPNGWKIYTSEGKRWKVTDTDIAFAYPSTWNLEEETITTWFDSRHVEETRIDSVFLRGEEYEVRIHQSGRGTSPDWIGSSVGGYGARMWQYRYSEAAGGSFPEDGLEYGTRLGVIDAGFIVEVRTSDEAKQLFNQFVSTIAFESSP